MGNRSSGAIATGSRAGLGVPRDTSGFVNRGRCLWGRLMNVSIFGLGYVGAVTGACLAKLGHRVIGVDPDQQKLRFLRKGKSPILEEGLDDLTHEAVQSGNF